jgi:homoserine dehydrogenase
MEAHKRLTIGLFGFGVVGEGLYKILQQTPSLKATIKRVCVKNPDRPRNAPAELFTTDRDLLLNDPDINVIVEVINETEAAWQIVSTALRNGKDVVSASKKMLSEHFPELLALQEETGRSLLYEASSCASIPVIRNLEEYYDNDLLHGIRGIVNGSTNFILTRMFEDKLDFRSALILAQQLGFAESDPSLDVEGWDAVNKWSLLLAHAYGIVAHPSTILRNGIDHIHLADAAVGREKGLSIRLVAQAQKLQNGKVAAFLMPQFVTQDDHLAFVRNEYNGVVIESGFADRQFFYGKGAGSFPTASAVLSDIAALRYQYRYEYKKKYHHTPLELTEDFYLRAYVSMDNTVPLPKEHFETLEEWHSDAERKYLIGILPFSALRKGDWWHTMGTSLILMPDPIIENMEIPRLKKISLELAGIS